MLSLPPDPFVVELSGELTIRSMTDIHARLLDALQTNGSVTAKIAEDATVDLTFIQLIEAARRSAREDGKAFALGAPAAGPLLESLQRGGFLTEADPDSREFWLAASGDR